VSDALTRAVRQALETLQPEASVLCALSGGADSVAMTHCVMTLCRQAGRPVAAAHFNHHLRGAESDRDEAFVRTLCEAWALPLTVGGGVVEPQGTGVEDAARRLRYAFLRETAGDGWIATAHTMDDQAETVLLQLMRGTGLRGLGGIAPAQDRLLRPLLQVRRAEVEAYLTAQGLPHIEDSSNVSDDYRRNRVRHRLLPWMAEENPRIVPALSELSAQARREEDFLNELTEAALVAARTAEGLNCTALGGLHPALRVRVLRAFASMPLTSRQTAALEALACGVDPSAEVTLPDGWTARRVYDCLRVERTAPAEGWEPVRLPIPGSCAIPALGWTITAEICRTAPKISQNGYTFCVAHDTIAGDVWIRPRQTGDRLRLSGGSRTLKRLMIDRRIPVAQRDRMPVLADDNGVLAVPGLATDLPRQALSGTETPCVRIRIETINGGTNHGYGTD